MSCEVCPCTYVEQPKRLVGSQNKKHFKEAELIKWDRKTNINSVVARHIVKLDHKSERITVLQEINRNKLDPCKSFFIGKKLQEHCLNTDMSNTIYK